MASSGSDVAYLQGIMITASPNRPVGTLTTSQQDKTYSSDLLDIFCIGCPPKVDGSDVLLKVVQVVGSSTDVKSYNATSCTHGGMTSGNWAILIYITQDHRSISRKYRTTITRNISNCVQRNLF